MKFLREVKNELKKSKWPDKTYMIKYSVATFSVVIMCSLYFYLISVLYLLVLGR